jgi:hypothetical protein
VSFFPAGAEELLKQCSLLGFVSYFHVRVASAAKFRLRAEADVGIPIASERPQCRNIQPIPAFATLGA